MKNQLNETTRRQKAQGMFNYKFNNVKTFCILSAENPLGVEYTRIENNTRVKDLLTYLKQEDFQFYPMTGVYNDTKERSMLIYNISLKETKYIASRFEQESFIFAVINDAKINFTYYQKTLNNKISSPFEYRAIETVEGGDYTNIEGETYSAIGKNFRFNIPFKIFSDANESINNRFDRRCSSILEYKENFEKVLDESVSDNSTFKHLRICRAMLYSDDYYKFWMDE